DIFLNIAGFVMIFIATSVLAVWVRTGLEKLLRLGLRWPALAFALISGVAWAPLCGFGGKEHLGSPNGRVLPLPAAGFLLGAAVVWGYIFAGVSDVLMGVGAVQYVTPGKPEDLLYYLTDSYMWHFFDLIPGLNITTALGWKSPVDLQGGVRGMLLVLFRVAVIYQVLAKGREIFKPDEQAGGEAGGAVLHPGVMNAGRELIDVFEQALGHAVGMGRGRAARDTALVQQLDLQQYGGLRMRQPGGCVRIDGHVVPRDA